MESFHVPHNLEEELMIAMRRQDTIEDHKVEARARILSAIEMRGPVIGFWGEIRTALGLDDIPLPLFKRSCWHLARGDRNEKGQCAISVRRMTVEDRKDMYERLPFVVTPLKQ